MNQRSKSMGNYCRILIIDDEFIMRQGIKHMIDWESEGFQIIGEAANGTEALKLIDSLEPHIIISDIVMPGLNGVDFAKIVQAKYPDIQILILSSYNDFEYVKSTLLSGAIDYILKPSLNPTELMKSLKKAAGKISGLTISSDRTLHINSTISRYILGFHGDLDLNAFRDLFPLSSYFIFGIHLKQIYGKSNEKYHSFSNMLKTCRETTLQEYSCELVFINDEVLFLIINYSEEYQNTLLHSVKKTADFCILQEPKAFFCLSRPFQRIDEIKDIYNNSFIPLTMRRFYCRGSSLLMDYKKHAARIPPKFDFKQYSKLITSNQYNEALTLLYQYTVQAMNEFHMDEFELKSLLKNNFYQIILAFEEQDIIVSHLKQESFSQIDEVEYADELLNHLDYIILTFRHILEENQNNLGSHMITKILAYIEENYAEPLDLAEVANQFNFNYHYLSSYFSSHNQEGFSEYLTKIRIEKAKELLSRNQLPIFEISGSVGYSDHSYFCRVFKKTTGYTPSSYRKKNTSILHS